MARRNKAPLSELAVKMKADLVLSGKRPKTVKAYLAAVRQLARYYGTPPDRLDEAQVRSWLVYLADKKTRDRDTAANSCRSEVLLRGDVSAGLAVAAEHPSAEVPHAAGGSLAGAGSDSAGPHAVVSLPGVFPSVLHVWAASG